MFNSIKERIRPARLQRELKQFTQKHQFKLDEIRFYGVSDDDSLPLEEQIKVWEYENMICSMQSEKLRDLADEWGIEIKKDWVELRYTPQGEPFTYLSSEWIKEIQDTIRAKRRENIEWWVTKVIVPLAGVITGLLGIIIALLALKYKK